MSTLFIFIGIGTVTHWFMRAGHEKAGYCPRTGMGDVYSDY